jgi:predicted Zn-dependent peptidase
MKKIKTIRLLIIALFVPAILFSQQKFESLKIKTFKLDNGLTVYLNEDHSVPNVLGAVIIKTGGKYDPANATGTSHYLEHMMFKGTDMIGTVDYKSEKVYLDSIALRYEELAKTTDPELRKVIQKQINQLSLEAGKFAIPNELDRMLDQIGSSGVNAFTSEEIVAYFNEFPKNQMEKWLMIYSHRFKNPVFRLFQSELETVFEEKNMYTDDFSTNLIETFYKNLYKQHPYGTQTVIGKSEHIKNPSLNNMRKMYETYYVANNMALVLTGNFNPDEVIPLIKTYFGDWKNGTVPEYPIYQEAQFNGIERVNERMTPIKIGLLGFRTVKNNSEDEQILEVCQALLSNSASTGYLDKLSLNGTLMEVVCFNDIRNDYGSLMVLYVPKIIGQSLKKAEKIVYDEIMKLHEGEIDPAFFEAVKLGLIKEHEQSLENTTDRAFLIAQLFTTNKTWEDIIEYPDQIAKITIEDVKRVSEKYLNENLLSLQSKMGFPKKDKLEKPGFDPVIPKNTEAKSEYAAKMENMPEQKSEPEFINFDKDLSIIKLDNGAQLYYVKNSINDIFNLKIKFYVGKYSDNRYEQLAEYLQLIGTTDLDLSQFNDKLQSIGCSYYISAEDNFFVINIDGFDKYFNESIKLVSSLLTSPKADDSKLKNLTQNATFLRQFEKSSPDELAEAIFQYGVFGVNSSYLRIMTQKDVSSLSSEDLLTLLATTITNKYSVHYSGTNSEKEVQSFLQENIKFQNSKTDSNFPIVLPHQTYTENTILLLDDPKSLQSRIYFYIEGNENNLKEKSIAAAFNQYFGTGMSSLVFQEIREFRSMAYSAYGMYRNGFMPTEKGYLKAFVGTQSDKTVDAISVMDSLINQMPQKENRMPSVKSALIQSVNSTKPQWRDITETVERWQIQQYKEDPRITQFKVFNSVEFNNILDFYKTNIKGRPMVITIVGNKEQINMEELAKFGKIIEVEKKQILN